MVLSDRTIREEIDSGRIAFDPYDANLIQPSSVDVRVDRQFRGSRGTGFVLFGQVLEPEGHAFDPGRSPPERAHIQDFGVEKELVSLHAAAAQAGACAGSCAASAALGASSLRSSLRSSRFSEPSVTLRLFSSFIMGEGPVTASLI